MPSIRRPSIPTRLLVSALVAGATAPTLAQQPVEPFLLFEHEGLDRMLVDERDDGLKHAMTLLPQRISELPDEIPDMDPEVAVFINTVLATVARPARVSIAYNPNTAAYGAFGYGLVVSIDVEDKGDAEHLHAIVNAIIEESDPPYDIVESERFALMSEIAHPAARMAYGPREADDGWRYEMVVGSVSDPSAGFEQFAPDPDGIDVVSRVRVDFAGLTTGLQFAHAMAGNQDPEMANLLMKKLEQAGLTGENAMAMDVHAGYTDSESVAISRVENANKFWDFLKLRRDAIPSDHYELIPADAYVATAAQLDLRFIEAIMDHAAEFGAPVDEFEREFTKATGLHLRNDILRMFGGTGMYYTSDSTGGGSIMSSVVIMQLTDRNGFLGTHHHLLEMANDAAGQIPFAGRYMRLEPWSTAGMEFVSLRFNGLPVPLELTYGIVGQWFVMSPTPQGALAAGFQISGRGGDAITTNPRFKSSIPTDKNLYAFSFIDPDRTLRYGYPLVSMLGSAITNGLRSPAGTRDPGMVVPTYGILARDAKPVSSYCFWDGDTLVSEYHADRSFLVNLATQLGSSGPGFGGGFFPLLQMLGEMERHSSAHQPWRHGSLAPHMELVGSLVAIPEPAGE